MQILFWNIEDAYNSARIDYLNEAAKIVDIIILAEAKSKTINKAIVGFSLMPTTYTGQTWIKFFKKDSNTDFNLKFKVSFVRNRIVVAELQYNNKLPIEIFGLHLGSKVGKDNASQAIENIPAAEEIHKYHKRSLQRSILVGDFNHNPFEPFMNSVNMLNSIPNRRLITDLKHRSLDYFRKSIFYNPMWNFLGDNQFNGSFFYKNQYHTKVEDIHWNLLDQVLISSSIMKILDPINIKILSSYKNTTTNQIVFFADERYYPKNRTYMNPELSDHLPLIFEIETSKIPQKK